MEYSKIKDLQKSGKLTEVDMGEIIGLSGPGFSKMMIKKTCRVEYIEKYAEHFKKPIAYFFDKEESGRPDEAGEQKQGYAIKRIECLECIGKQKEIDALKSAIDAKDELLEMYRGKKGKECG